MNILNLISALISYFGLCYVYLYYIPHLSRYYTELHARLPQITIFSLYVSQFLQSYTLILLFFLVGFVGIFWKVKPAYLKFISPIMTLMCVLGIVVGLMGVMAPILELEKIIK
jgi:asparagine N-glycosylation enzyme membrane subunit Stt3